MQGRRTVLVTGVGGPAGKAAARYFREQGLRVHGTDIVPVDSEATTFSLIPRGDSPEYASAILDIARRELPLLFVCTVTEEIPAAASLKEPLRALGVSVFATDHNMAVIANDKYLTARYLRASGIAVPLTFADCECPSALEAGEVLGYPFIVKPRRGRGGRGVRVIFDRATAADETRTDVAYQEFLGGEEYDVNLFAYPAGRLAALQIFLKTGLKQGIVGNATGVKPVGCPAIAELAGDVVRVMRLEGGIDMDVRLTESGVPKVIEVNARVGAHVRQAAGVLEQMLQESLAGVHA
ncbi:MAG: ATP-grasp domain-containing protein [Bacteroidota bacterium]